MSKFYGTVGERCGRHTNATRCGYKSISTFKERGTEMAFSDALALVFLAMLDGIGIGIYLAIGA